MLWVRRHWPYLTLGLLVAVLAALLMTPFHLWGDDWTLYVRQAEGLVHWRVRDVIADVGYTVDHSPQEGFTPRGYPWGTPLLLSLPVALFGRNLWALKSVMVIATAVGAVGWFVTARRILGATATALVSTGIIFVSTAMLLWTGVINSDLPYVMMVGISVAAFATWCHDDLLDRRRVVLLGLLGAACFAFRQEGLATFAALMSGVVAHRLSGAEGDVRRTTHDLVTATTAFVATAAFLAVILPSELLPRYSGTGVGNVRSNLGEYSRAVGRLFDVYDIGEGRVEALSVPAVGWLLASTITILGVTGLFVMLERRRPVDVILIMVGVTHTATALIFPYPDARYLYVPFAVGSVLVVQGAVAMGGLTRRPTVVALMIALPLVAVHLPSYVRAADSAADARRIGLPFMSPYETNVQEMFAAICDNTAPDDVIAGGHARTITLFTDRRAVQVVGDLVPPPEADWWVADIDRVADGDEVVWSNDRYALIHLG